MIQEESGSKLSPSFGSCFKAGRRKMHRFAAVWVTIRLGLASEREECATAVGSEAFGQQARVRIGVLLSLPTVSEDALSTFSLRQYHRVLDQLLGWHFDSEELAWTVAAAAVGGVGVGDLE